MDTVGGPAGDPPRLPTLALIVGGSDPQSRTTTIPPDFPGLETNFTPTLILVSPLWLPTTKHPVNKRATEDRPPPAFSDSCNFYSDVGRVFLHRGESRDGTSPPAMSPEGTGRGGTAGKPLFSGRDGGREASPRRAGPGPRPGPALPRPRNPDLPRVKAGREEGGRTRGRRRRRRGGAAERSAPVSEPLFPSRPPSRAPPSPSSSPAPDLLLFLLFSHHSFSLTSPPPPPLSFPSPLLAPLLFQFFSSSTVPSPSRLSYHSSTPSPPHSPST